DTASPGEIDVSFQAIVYGRPSPPETREDAVVFLRTEFDGRELMCSGTLVAANLVITARHCVSYVTDGSFMCTAGGELVEDGSGAGHAGLHLPAESIEIHTGDGADRRLIAHGAHVLSTVSETVCLDDLAFVVLDRELDLPRMALRLERSTAAGEAVSLTGYGLDESMDFETPFAELRRNTRDDLTISEVGPLLAEDVTTVPPRTLVLTEPAGCVGDSGAPLYATESGAVVGVYSLLAGDSCVSASGRSHFAHVPAYLALIDDAFRAAGATLRPEGALRELGESCETTSDCRLGACRDGGAGSVCTQRCERTSDCPPDFACSSGTEGHCVVEDGTGGSGGGGSGEAGAPVQAGADGTESESTGGTGNAGQRDAGCSIGPRPRNADRAAWLGMLAFVAVGRRLRLLRQRRPSRG
ncbi:MAG TPA: trypsin-like serine protease, partial [Polyangiaceae bacterium]|nr:trypsin-like serine protease [Polyangiaceae bacterium]